MFKQSHRCLKESLSWAVGELGVVGRWDYLPNGMLSHGVSDNRYKKHSKAEGESIMYKAILR